MIPLTSALSTANAGARPGTSPWMASLYGGIASALIAAASGLLLGTNMPVLYILAFLLIGAGPVLGYQLAAGKLGQDWKTLLGGIIGFILPILSPLILWPLLVWAFNRSFGLGKLWLGSLLGFILGVAGFFALGLMIGQDPAWVGMGWAVLWSLWGGAAAAFMASSVNE
ncbi:MAG: hypothetical protein WAU00_13690 [Caldilinea sp.]|uniref:hypothetical protein n=1 Tax=Caldilinea sp. TaxID=2293560 RepID=UPI002B9BD729|nr:hypothetical protein [Anaerolineales bacterium]HQY92310.1 hypothetical protein [Caldilinea sp.]HRA66300.1 hypothetical protein [Caldilinea sp.]